jgi:hypothetical protein
LAEEMIPVVWPYITHQKASIRLNAAYAVLKCCQEKQLLMEAQALLQGCERDKMMDAGIQYVRYKLRKACGLEPAQDREPSGREK